MIGYHTIYRVCGNCGYRRRNTVDLEGRTDEEVRHIKGIIEVESVTCYACGKGYYKFTKDELKGAEMPLSKDKGDWKKTATPEDVRRGLIKKECDTCAHQGVCAINAGYDTCDDTENPENWDDANEVESLKAEGVRLRGLLKKYGQHQSHCEKTGSSSVCTCGLDGRTIRHREGRVIA